MPRRRISSGSTFEAEHSYSRAVVDGRWIFVSGTTGFDYKTMTIADDVAAQTEQTFDNIETALRAARATLDDIVRVRYILPDGKDFARAAPVCRRRLATALPAATMLVAGLIDPRIKIEIEVTARRRRRKPGAAT